jgi:histidyl-tRNA synthetase
VGSNALLNEVEFVQLYHDVFKKLGLEGYELRLNSRKLLTALAEQCGGAEQMLPITIAIDKLDKIGLDAVKEELRERGLNGAQVSMIENYLEITGSNAEKLENIKRLFAHSEVGKKGIEELEYILENSVSRQPAKVNLVLDFTLARGLNYYTGAIFEAKAPAQVKIGSIGGGGRYDDLTGLFGVPGMPGVGISFGVDRIYDVLEELQLFPQTVAQGTTVLLFHPGGAINATYGLLKKLREQGIASELYHEPAKGDKQFKYAEKKNIPYIIRDVDETACTIKNIRTGAQQILKQTELSAETFRT